MERMRCARVMENVQPPGADDLRELLVQIAEMYMPFGMYGPAKFPPKGCPISDLPGEYLDWFAQRGWPKGKLGYLMQQTFLIKNSGLDHLFDPFREARGGFCKYPRKK